MCVCVTAVITIIKCEQSQLHRLDALHPIIHIITVTIFLQSLTCSRSSPCEPVALVTAEVPLAPEAEEAEAEASAGLCCGPFSPPDAAAAVAAPFVSPITASVNHRTILGKADPALKVTCTA